MLGFGLGLELIRTRFANTITDKLARTIPRNPWVQPQVGLASGIAAELGVGQARAYAQEWTLTSYCRMSVYVRVRARVRVEVRVRGRGMSQPQSLG